MNLMASEAGPLIAEDLKTFTPLFGKALESTKGPPKCDVLLIYARIESPGKVARSDRGLRELIRDWGPRS